MHPIKYLWAIRALIYKPFFKKIGWFCYIGKPCFISGKNNIFIGNRTRIFPGIRMECINKGKIVIGNNCVLEQNVHIISENEELSIDSNVTISANVFISNVNHSYFDINKSVMDQEHIIKNTHIGEGTFLGYGSVVLPGTILGKHCIVGSNSVVNGIFPDNVVLAGVPAKIIKYFDKKSKSWKKNYD